MTNNLQKLQKETEKKYDEYMLYLPVNTEALFLKGVNDEKIPTFRHAGIKQFILEAQLLAYNQGVKDSVEALPEEVEVSKGNDCDYHTDTGYNLYREEVITKLNQLMQ